MSKKHPTPKQKKQKHNKQTIFLVAGIVGGLLIFAISALIIILASRVDDPRYDFVYSDSYESRRYEVKDGKLDTKSTYSLQYYVTEPNLNLYRYDVSNNESTKLSLNEVQQLTLDSSKVSPDGFRVTTSYIDHDVVNPIAPAFPGGRLHSSQSTMVLKKGDYMKEIAIEGDRYDFQFIGWVKE